jgi:hypothetical protein
MTPQEFEWGQEQIENDYVANKIGKLTYIKRMSALGLNNIEHRREELRELDARRVMIQRID